MTSISPIFDGKPYIFFSYAHKNAHKSMRILTILQNEGFRIWYDDGLIPGDQYNALIDERIKKCSVIIPSLSIEYCNSNYCPRELIYAREAFAKPVVPIYLENPEKLKAYYKDGIGLWLSGESGFILNTEADFADFRKKIHEIEILFPCNKAYDDIKTSDSIFSEDNTSMLLSEDGFFADEKHCSFEDHLTHTNKDTILKTTHPSVIDSLLLVVKSNIHDGRFEEAEAQLNDILKDEPTNAEAHFYQLLVKYQVKSSDELAFLTTPVESADVRMAAIYQDQECRRTLLNALSQNQKYQQYLIATSHMAAGRYHAALSILDKLQNFLDTNQKISECNEIIRHDTLLIQYKSEIGDGKAYLSTKLKEEYPELFEQYSALCRQTANAPENGLFFLFSAIILAITGAGLFVIPENRIFFTASAVLSVAFGILICFINPIVGICIIAVLIYLLFMFKSVLSIILLILALIAFFCGISEWRSFRHYNKISAEKKSFYENQIKSFEEAACRDVDVRYADLLPNERKKLTSIEVSLTDSR